MQPKVLFLDLVAFPAQVWGNVLVPAQGRIEEKKR